MDQAVLAIVRGLGRDLDSGSFLEVATEGSALEAPIASPVARIRPGRETTNRWQARQWNWS